jgi:hypothetical protein
LRTSLTILIARVGIPSTDVILLLIEIRLLKDGFLTMILNITGYYYQDSENATKVYVNGRVRIAQTADDLYSKGLNLSGYDLPKILEFLVESGQLPEDETGVYFVLSSPDVTESLRPDLGKAKYCRDYCGYHLSWKMPSGKRLFYAFAGR